MKKTNKTVSAAWCGGPLKLLLLIFSAVMMATATGFAADCVDGDGDGYVASCTDCDLPSGKQCGDCDDSDASINPGAPEICGDNTDNDCDGIKLEPGGPCVLTGPPGTCPTGSHYVCSEDNLSLVCPVPSQGYKLALEESWNYPARCLDGVDNDCDGAIDMADCGSVDEVCDGYDNNYNGSIDETFTFVDDTGATRSIGDDCVVGIGACARTGRVICGSSSTAICTATAGAPREESLSQGNTCNDGKDNDCDGAVDLADSGCQPVASPEICDGIDNDLDGVADNGFDVGAPCTVGVGPCQNTGVKICKADGTGTICNALPLAASIEGPSGPTCYDGIDNDCDGAIDLVDPSCDAAAAGLQVVCALPYTVGQPGGDCNGKHLIEYQANLPTAQVSAELLGLSPSGEVLGVLPGVKPGEEAHLASRLDPMDFKMSSKTNKKGTRHEVFAPVPMLHVMARDGDAEAEAYCSMIPYLDVTRPNGAVVSVSTGDTTKVTVAIPLVRPKSLIIKVDGVDILPDILTPLGLTPATAFPGGPYDGAANVNGQMVVVEDLVVASSSGAIDTPSSNTLTMTLKNLGGGGHIIYVDGEPVQLRPRLTKQCLRDDIADAGSVAALSVLITAPAELTTVSGSPVPIEGQVKHGRKIASLKVSGLPVDVSGQVFTPGDGINSADQYVLDFVKPLAEVNLKDAVDGVAPIGTLQRGANKVVADALDDLGNRAFDTQMFGLGSGLSSAQLAGIKATVETNFKTQLKSAYENFILSVPQEVQNAIVAGVEPSAVDNFFAKLCPTASTEFQGWITNYFQGKDLGTVDVDPDCSCAVSAHIIIQSIVFTEEAVCKAELLDGQINVSFELPDVTVTMHAYDDCETEGWFGECLAETILDVTAITKIDDPVFTYVITANEILTHAPPAEDSKAFVIGSLRYPGSNGESLENSSDVWSMNSEINCWGAAVCSFFETAAAVLIDVFTLGFVDGFDVFDWVSVTFDTANFEDVTAANEQDAMGIGDLKIDKQVVEEFGKAIFTPTLADIQITPAGLIAVFDATFQTELPDPEVEATPPLVPPAPAALPALPQGTEAQNAFIVLADDSINQLFASMAESGGLKTTCKDTGKTVINLLPADCETLSGVSPLATATIQGLCHGMKVGLDDCEALTNADLVLQGTEQGVCHGARGDDCSTIPVVGLGLVEKAACSITPKVNLLPDDPLLFCAKQSIPPQLLIKNMADPQVPQDALDVSVLLNDLTVAIVVDRSGVTPAVLDGQLSGIPNCFSADAAAQADCYLYTACVDITINAGMSLLPPDDPDPKCNAGETGFVFSVSGVIPSGLQSGVMCGGAATQAADDTVTNVAAQDQTVTEITDNVEYFTPPLCAQGLNLGGLLTFQNPKLIAINTSGDANFADYFGIIGEVK